MFTICSRNTLRQIFAIQTPTIGTHASRSFASRTSASESFAAKTSGSDPAVSWIVFLVFEPTRMWSGQGRPSRSILASLQKQSLYDQLGPSASGPMTQSLSLDFKLFNFLFDLGTSRC